jgi:hypothetical protein
MTVTGVTMPDNHAENPPPDSQARRRWKILGWMLLGGIVSALLVAAFLAYGQPELLLEQLNLRYCG